MAYHFPFSLTVISLVVSMLIISKTIYLYQIY